MQFSRLFKAGYEPNSCGHSVKIRVKKYERIEIKCDYYTLKYDIREQVGERISFDCVMISNQ